MKTMNPQQLENLITRARNSDEEAITELLEFYSDRLLSTVRAELGQRLRTRLESQDIMQQVYHDALANIDRFVDRGQDSFFAWLRRIALNRICDSDRQAFQTIKRGKEVRVGDLAGESMYRLLDDIAANQTTPSGAVNREDCALLLRKALDRLTDDQRQVIEYRYLNQLSITETASRMDRTERAIRSLSVRAIIRLRELLDQKELEQ